MLVSKATGRQVPPRGYLIKLLVPITFRQIRPVAGFAGGGRPSASAYSSRLSQPCTCNASALLQYWVSSPGSPAPDSPGPGRPGVHPIVR